MATNPIRAYLINGIAFSFASAQVVISCPATGQSVDLENVGLTAINFKRERDRGEPLRGGHPDPLAKVRGENKYTASLKAYKSVRDYIVENVLGGSGHGDRIFNVTVTYLENGLDAKLVEIRGCTWDSDGSDNQKGTDATEVEVNLSPLKVLGDGFDDVDNPLVNVAA
jgi:hypothetical protein